MTTARFIRPGPAPRRPRIPAVPNARGAANRSASSDSSPRARMRSELGASRLVRIARQPGFGSAAELGEIERRAHGAGLLLLASASAKWVS